MSCARDFSDIFSERIEDLLDLTPEEVARLEAEAELRSAARAESWIDPKAQLRQEILANLCRDHALVPVTDVRIVAMDRARGLASVDEASEVIEQLWRGGDLLITTDRQHVTTIDVARAIGLASTDVVIVDEAGQLDHERYAALIEMVSKAEATLIQVGDDEQLSPVSPGGLWTVVHSMAEAEGATAELETVRRARDKRESQAWTDLREGRITTALGYWHERGRLKLHDGREGLIETMVSEWWADGRRGAMVVDSSNAERNEINRRAQARRLEAGELGAEAVELVSGRRLHKGDEVIFNEIYRSGVKVKNGTVATVASVNTETAAVLLTLHEPRRTEPREVVVNAGAPVELAYCRHIAKAQGMTVDGVANVGVGSMTNHNSLYTAVSRGKDGADPHGALRDSCADPTYPGRRYGSSGG